MFSAKLDMAADDIRRLHLLAQSNPIDAYASFIQFDIGLIAIGIPNKKM